MIKNLRGLFEWSDGVRRLIHVSSIEEANDKITAFETATTSRFC